MDPRRTRRQVLHMLGAAAAVGAGFGLGLWRKWARAPSAPAAAGIATTSTTSTTDAATTTAAPAATVPATTTTAAATTTVPATTTTTTTAATTTTVAPSVLEVIERAAWGAGPQSGEFSAHTVERITVHHSGGLFLDNRAGPDRVLGYQRFHQGRDFVDIAYHFAIDLNGNVYEARDYGVPGETFTSYDPTGHFLPMCIGNFEEQPIGDAQFGTLVDIVAWAVTRFAVGVDTISGHRDHAATACPGEDLYARLVDGTLAARVGERLAGGGVELLYLRGDEARDRVAAIAAGQA